MKFAPLKGMPLIAFWMTRILERRKALPVRGDMEEGGAQGFVDSCFSTLKPC